MDRQIDIFQLLYPTYKINKPMGNQETKIALKKPRVIGGVGVMKSNNGTQFYNQDRIYEGDITAEESFQPYYSTGEEEIRIRKLTPTECFRLQGLKDEDIKKLDGISDSIKYHLAGDSIVVNVLMAIFKEML